MSDGDGIDLVRRLLLVLLTTPPGAIETTLDAMTTEEQEIVRRYLRAVSGVLTEHADALDTGATLTRRRSERAHRPQAATRRRRDTPG